MLNPLYKKKNLYDILKWLFSWANFIIPNFKNIVTGILHTVSQWWVFLNKFFMTEIFIHDFMENCIHYYNVELKKPIGDNAGSF